MSRVFAYCRVSSLGQTTDNQIQEIGAAGFKITAQRTITETISGSVAALQRKGFIQLLNKLEEDDVLVVTKLDRLGRNAMDIRATVDHLSAIGVRVHCLQLGGADLTSSAGKMIMSVLAAMAELERDLLIERTKAGQVRAKAEGKLSGRPSSLSPIQQQSIKQHLADGVPVAVLARDYKTTRQTIMRVRAKS